MRLRWSIVGALVAGFYVFCACLLTSREAVGNAFLLYVIFGGVRWWQHAAAE